MTDIGLGDWLFDLDKPDELARIVPTAIALAKDPAQAKAKAMFRIQRKTTEKSTSNSNQIHVDDNLQCLLPRKSIDCKTIYKNN